METPGRQELRKAYEEISDDQLMIIARNADGEYENAASEVAMSVLRERGVSLSDNIEGSEADDAFASCTSCGTAEPAPGLNSGGAISGPALEIRSFTAEETGEIQALLTENRIAFERLAEMKKSCSSCGTQYVYRVPEQSFMKAAGLIKEHLVSTAASASSGGYNGPCPACGTEVRNGRECPDCGLTLVVDYMEGLEGHPFFKYLGDNNIEI